MNLALKDSIILKTVNEQCVFAVDCNDENDFYFKFNGAAKFFIEQLKEGKSEDEILMLAISTFTGCDKKQVKNDWDDFVQSIQNFKLVKA